MTTPPLLAEVLGIGTLYYLMRDAVTVTDLATGLVVLANPAAERLFGAPADQLVGQSVEALVPEHLRASALAQLETYRTTGTTPWIGATDPVELDMLRTDGAVVQVEFFAHQVTVADRHFAVAFTRDVTERKRAERKRAEQAILTSEVRLRAVFDRAGTGIAVADLNGYPIAANPALCRMLGFDEGELRTRSFVDVTHPDDVAADLDLGRELRWTPAPMTSRPFTIGLDLW